MCRHYRTSTRGIILQWYLWHSKVHARTESDTAMPLDVLREVSGDMDGK